MIVAVLSVIHVKHVVTGCSPHLAKIAGAGVDPDAPETRDERFEFGLSCMLDGIAARITELA